MIIKSDWLIQSGVSPRIGKIAYEPFIRGGGGVASMLLLVHVIMV